MVGIPPSVALFRHFFSLHLVDDLQCSGCVTFQAEAATAGSGINFAFRPVVEGFQKQWVFVDATTHSPRLQLPRGPPIPNFGWGQEKLVDRRLAPVWARLVRMKNAKLTAPMVVREFVRRRIAPLQRHSRPMWTFFGKTDSIRLQVPSLPPKTLGAMLKLLTGDPAPAALPEDGSLLYNCSNKESFLKLVPPCDEWGLRPKGLVGPRENPILVTPMLGHLAAYAPDADVEGRTPQEVPKLIGVELT
jgi:hypothetical protein